MTLAIDTSGSVSKDMAEEADAARRFAHAILRPQDQMSLLQFATDVQRADALHQQSFAHRSWAGPVAWRLCNGALRRDLPGLRAARAARGRKVLVLVSDGDDTAKNSTYAQALEQAALRNEVMIYSIIDVPIEASAGRDLGGEHALITLAEQTGGKSFYVSEGGLDKAFARGQ